MLSTPVDLMSAEVECPACGESLPVPIRLSIADMYTHPDSDGSAIWADTTFVRAHLEAHRKTNLNQLS